jgi:hypothetical protein
MAQGTAPGTVMRYTLVVDDDHDDEKFRVALAKSNMFLRPLRNGTVRLSFLPPNITDQTTREVDVKIQRVSAMADGATSICHCADQEGRTGV